MTVLKHQPFNFPQLSRKIYQILTKMLKLCPIIVIRDLHWEKLYYRSLKNNRECVQSRFNKKIF